MINPTGMRDKIVIWQNVYISMEFMRGVNQYYLMTKQDFKEIIWFQKSLATELSIWELQYLQPL